MMEGAKFIKTRQQYIDKVKHITKDLPPNESQSYVDHMYMLFDQQLDPKRIGDFASLYPSIFLGMIREKVESDSCKK